MASVIEERLRLIHQRLGPWHGLRIETAGVRGSYEQIRYSVYWTYTLILNMGTMRRHEDMAERSSEGYSLFTALGQVLTDIDDLETSIKEGVLVGEDRFKPSRSK